MRSGMAASGTGPGVAEQGASLLPTAVHQLSRTPAVCRWMLWRPR